MKRISKIKMKKIIQKLILILAIFPISSLSVAALFSEDTGTLLISDFKGTVDDGKVSLTWSAAPDQNGNSPEKFIIHYGTKSVAEGLAESYESTKESTEEKIEITELENGVPLFFAVNAIGKDETEGTMSEEIKLTPSKTTIDSPAVVSAEAIYKDEVVVEFSKEIVLPKEQPELSFTITEEDDLDKYLLVWGAKYYEEENESGKKTEDKKKVVLETEEQEKDKKYNVTASFLIEDTEGNPVASGVTDSAVFSGIEIEKETEKNSEEDSSQEQDADSSTTEEKTSSEDKNISQDNDQSTEEDDKTDPQEDKNKEDETSKEDEEENDALAPVADAPQLDNTPPEDITNLVITFKKQISNFMMKLVWTASLNSNNDLADQLLYHSLDKGLSWANPVSLGKTATSYQAIGQPETEHTFKITTKDLAGNESTGAIKSIRLPALPSTGPLSLAFLGAGLFLAGVSKLRKK